MDAECAADVFLWVFVDGGLRGCWEGSGVLFLLLGGDFGYCSFFLDYYYKLSFFIELHF